MSLAGGSTILAAGGASIAKDKLFEPPVFIFVGLFGEFNRGSSIGLLALDCCLKPLS